MQEMQERPAGHVLSFGAGVNSVALMVLLIRERMPLDEVVFADTGAELPETYAYLDTAKAFLADHGVPFTILKPSARSGGGLYQTAWRRRVIPSAIWRWSTRDFKVNPLKRHYRQHYTTVTQYLGIAYDELERMKTSSIEGVTSSYPLIDRRVTRAGCLEIIAEAGLPEPVKSGCFFCPFNSLDRWRWLRRVHPDLYERAVALEENSKHFPDQRLTDQAFRKRATVTLRALGPQLDAGLKVVPAGIAEMPCGAECHT